MVLVTFADDLADADAIIFELFDLTDVTCDLTDGALDRLETTSSAGCSD